MRSCGRPAFNGYSSGVITTRGRPWILAFLPGVTDSIEFAAKMNPLPADEQNPLTGGANLDHLILWLAYKEAKASIKFDAVPAVPAAPKRK